MTSNPFTYHKAKVIQALRYHFISRKEVKILLILINVFSILAAGLFYFKKIGPKPFLLSACLWFGIMVVFWFIMPNLVYRRSATFKDGFVATVNENGLALENDRGRKQWLWNEFSHWIESPHFFHFYFSPTAFFILPKDAFADDMEHEARKVIREHVKAG